MLAKSSRLKTFVIFFSTPRAGVPKNTGDWGYCMDEQMVPPLEPPETEVVPRWSPRGSEAVAKVFAPRMPPFLNQRLGCLRLA
eukprot:1158278-Pelagomonas_calceolata.AAC.2